MIATHRSRIGRNLAATAVLLALGLLLLAPPARSANVVNVTIHIPAVVYDNPCVGEQVALHGDLHILLSITTDQAGGYHYVSTWNASYSGTGLTTGAALHGVGAQAGVVDRQAAPGLAHHHLGDQAHRQGRAQNAFISTTMTPRSTPTAFPR